MMTTFLFAPGHVFPGKKVLTTVTVRTSAPSFCSSFTFRLFKVNSMCLFRSLLQFAILLLLIAKSWNRRSFEDRDVRQWINGTISSSIHQSRRVGNCDKLDSSELMQRLRDQGLYDPAYLAPDIKTAAELFPYLDDDEQFTKTTNEYLCDDNCQQQAQQVRRIMGESKKVRVHYYHPTHTFLYTRPRYINARLPTTQRQRSRRQSQRRKIIDDSVFIMKNSGRTPGVIGTTFAIGCGLFDDHNVPSNMHKLCRSCAAVRKLPEEFFPRVLNEVICGNDLCVRGHGQCIQRFLPFKVLRNHGTFQCQNWELVTIQLRTCCDCMVDRSSAILRYISK